MTLTQLRTELQEKLGSTSNIKAGTTEQKNALNRALDELQMRANWFPTVRKKTFDFITSINEYSIANYLGLSDFKDVYRFQGEDISKHDTRRIPGGEYYGVHFKDNGKFLAIKLDNGTTKLVDGLTNLTNDGIWSAVGDATNLEADLKEYLDGSGSFKFDIDESASANDYAGVQNTTKNSQDLTDYEDRSYFVLDVYLPTASNITSIQLFWGSSNSAYWSLTTTAPVDSASFQDGWNVVKFKWSDATQTGSPDVSAIDYYEIRFNYSSGISDQNNARVSNLRCDIREQVDLEYFSTYMATDSLGTYKSRFANSTDLFLGEDDMKPLLLDMAYLELIRNNKSTDKGEFTRTRNRIEQLLAEAEQDYAFKRTKGRKRIMTKL